jgi:hypothetical protein
MERLLLMIFGALALLILIAAAVIGNRLHRGKTSISIKTHLILAKIGLILMILHAAVVFYLYYL